MGSVLHDTKRQELRRQAIVMALFMGCVSPCFAGPLLDEVLKQSHEQYFAASSDQQDHTASSDPVRLDPITVYGKPDPWGLPGNLREALPCLGCDGPAATRPFLLDVAKNVAGFAARPFFQQPRCRGEPNDEAAYYALRAAQDLNDSPMGLDRQPNEGLFNWQYDEHQCR